jgi:hypothetical protein
VPSLIVARADHRARRLILTIVSTVPLLLAAPLGAQDSSFLLTAHASERRFPAYLGNGQLGVTGSPTGLDAMPSLLTRAYDHRRDDVPRIVAVPAWNDARLSDRTTRLGDEADGDSALRAYQQTLNMYDGVLRAVPPVLAFPDPALDDTVAYQGYRTRLFRDARKNAVQIYLDRRSGRVVHLWADAVDESLGFTARDSAGAPAAVNWGSDSATVAESADVRTLTYQLTAPGRQLTLGWFLLGSMRVERDFQYERRHLAPFAPAPFEERELAKLVADLQSLGTVERRRQLALLHAPSLVALRARLAPRIACVPAAPCSHVHITRPSLDGRTHLALDLRVDPRRATLSVRGQTVVARARGSEPVALTITIATDAPPLSPLDRDEIFTPDFLRFLARTSAAADTLARAAGTSRLDGDAAAAVSRARWMEREVRGVELLSAREKLMAGLPNFATYFGRDMMMAALMMRPIWKPEMSAHVIGSVLRKLGPQGDVSHEEALGGQAIREHAVIYDSLITAYRTLDHVGDRRRADSALARARAVLANLRTVRENYHMMDDELQLPVLAARWLGDSSVRAETKRAFLLDTVPEQHATRLALLLRELALVARETAPYARDSSVQHLIAFPKLDSTHWRSASWRDSRAGYANGRFAMDINVIWAPAALDAIADILAELRALGLPLTMPDDRADTTLARYARDPSLARRAAGVWRGAERHFVVTLGAREIQARVSAKLAWLPESESGYWQRVSRTRGITPDSLAFLALSLDSAGHPIPVVNTDPATRLFLAGARVPPEHGPVSRDVLLRDVSTFVRPYPVGLFVARVGPLVANDTYAPRDVWDVFRDDTYHSPRVVWGREVELILLGLAQQIAAATESAGAPVDPSLAPYVDSLRTALRTMAGSVEGSGVAHSELWSYTIDGDVATPIRYGTSSDVQLWSTTDLAVQYMMSRLPHR